MQQTPNSEVIPILNSFLTSIPQNIQANSFIQPLKKPSKNPQREVQQWFQAELQQQHFRKQREAAKQAKLKAIQDGFEQQRVKRQRQIDQKLSMTHRNRDKKLFEIQQKFRRMSVRHQKVFSRVQDQHMKEITKNLQSRRIFESEADKRESRQAKSSLNSSRDEKSKEKVEIVEGQIGLKIEELVKKMEKAKIMNKYKNDQTANRARTHNAQVQTINLKAKQLQINYLNSYTNKILQKMQTAGASRQQRERILQKKGKERHKSYSQKLRKIHNNLVQMQEEQEIKLEELSKKLQREAKGSDCSPSSRTQQIKHQERLKALQQHKVAKANQIVQKHQDIALKNYLIKQKKQYLYRCLREDSP